MKTIHTPLIFILSFFLFSIKSSAQFKIGPYFGLTYSKITPSPLEPRSFHNYPDEYNRKNYSIGISVQKFLSEKWLIKSEVQYVQLGSRVEKVDYKWKDFEMVAFELEYLNANFFLTKFIRNHLFIEGGIYNSLLLNTQIDFYGFGGFTTSKTTGYFSNSDFGLAGSIGIEKWNIFLKGSHFRGIKNIRQESKNRFYQLSLGYVIEL